MVQARLNAHARLPSESLAKILVRFLAWVSSIDRLPLSVPCQLYVQLQINVIEILSVRSTLR